MEGTRSQPCGGGFSLPSTFSSSSFQTQNSSPLWAGAGPIWTPVRRPILGRPGIYFYSSPQALSEQAAGSPLAGPGRTWRVAPLGWVRGASHALQTGLRAAPEGLQRERATSDLACSSDAPQARPRPSARSCCLCVHVPVLLWRFPARRPPPQPPAHLLSPPLSSQLPQLELAPPPQAQLCWSRPVPLPSGSAAPRWPALPRAAGRVPCGRLPSLAHEGPSAQVLSCWALVGGLGGPHPSASGTSTVFGLLWGAPTPQLCSPVGGPHSLPAQLRGAASVRGPGLSAHQGARHLHTGAALTLGLGVAPE